MAEVGASVRAINGQRIAPATQHHAHADGHLDEFKEAVRHAVEFVEQHGPQLMGQVFVDDTQMVAHSFQLYPDSAAIPRPWRLSDPYIRDVS